MKRAELLTRCLMIVALLSMMSCTQLTPQDSKYYSSRLYDLPYERVFNAVHARVAEYPMGVREADQTKGIVQSRIGGTTPGVEATGSYQVTVAISQVGNRIRVTPDWKKNRLIKTDQHSPASRQYRRTAAALYRILQ